MHTKTIKNVLTLALIILMAATVFAGCGNNDLEKESYVVTIHIKYEESSGLNYRDDAKLFIDDKEIADVEYASETDYTVNLTNGEHEIYLKRDTLLRKNSTNKITVDVDENNKFISIIAKENAISGLKIELSDATQSVDNYQQNIEEKNDGLEGTIEITDDSLKLTQKGIEDNLSYMIIERMASESLLIGSKIESIELDTVRELYDCVVTFKFNQCTIDANILLNYQGGLVGADIVEKFDGNFNQDLYDEFCKAVGYIAVYFHDEMWKEIYPLLMIEKESYIDYKTADSTLFGAEYSFDYDLKNEKKLRFVITMN
ncbi:MAG: hypothetical protein ACI4LP_05895 [Anaerovoracaceae bacterium]